MKTVILSTIIAAVVAANQPERNLVVRGDGDGSANFMVNFVTKSGRNFCGGTLIEPNVVLTAAHCFESTSLKSILGQANTLTSGPEQGNVMEIEQVIVHPKYNAQIKNAAHNIALVKLSSNVPNAITAVYDKSENTYTSGTATVAGWGLMNLKDRPSTQQSLTSNLVDDLTCGRYYSSFTSVNQICFGEQLFEHIAKSACDGDQGSPLYQDETVIGVMSYANGMCGKTYSIFTKVNVYASWISKTVEKLKAEALDRNSNDDIQVCKCSGTVGLPTDVGITCGKWGGSKIDWCYTDGQPCIAQVESVRYDGRYWTTCTQSLAEKAIQLDHADFKFNPNMPAENFELAINNYLLTNERAVDENESSDINAYAIGGGVVGGVVALAAGLLAVLNKRNSNNRPVSRFSTKAIANASVVGSPFAKV